MDLAARTDHAGHAQHRAMRFENGHGTQNDFVVVLDPDGHHGLTGTTG